MAVVVLVVVHVGKSWQGSRHGLCVVSLEGTIDRVWQGCVCVLRLERAADRRAVWSDDSRMELLVIPTYILVQVDDILATLVCRSRLFVRVQSSTYR
jgi:dUTPase